MNEFELLLELVERGKNIYYHLTADDYGPIVEFYPRIPKSADYSEPKVPRICVSPSIAGAMLAGSVRLSGRVYVYATRAQADPVDSRDVFDADVTEEHWILKPAVFVKVDEFDGSTYMTEEVNSYYRMVEFEPDYYSNTYKDEDDEYMDDTEMSSEDYHVMAKELLEKELGGFTEKIHKEAKHKLAEIVPRVKDIPGQGLFYFAKEEDGLEEAEEPDKMEIPKVKAPNNFHEAIGRSHRRNRDEE